MNGNGAVAKALGTILGGIALTALGTALLVWRQQSIIMSEAKTHATQVEVGKLLAARDSAFSSAVNALGKELAEANAKLDILLEERNSGRKR